MYASPSRLFVTLVVGPCIACSLRSGVALAVEILFFAPLSIVTKQELLRTKRCTSNESVWTKHVEESRYLEVAKKVRGIFDRDRSNTTCSALTIVHRLQKVQRLLQHPAGPQPATKQLATPHTLRPHPCNFTSCRWGPCCQHICHLHFEVLLMVQLQGQTHKTPGTMHDQHKG